MGEGVDANGLRQSEPGWLLLSRSTQLSCGHWKSHRQVHTQTPLVQSMFPARRSAFDFRANILTHLDQPLL